MILRCNGSDNDLKVVIVHRHFWNKNDGDMIFFTFRWIILNFNDVSFIFSKNSSFSLNNPVENGHENIYFDFFCHENLSFDRNLTDLM